MASRVEKRIAFTLPVFKWERFTFDIPTLAASSFNLILRSASTLSSLIIIGMFYNILTLQRGVVFLLEIDPVIKYI